MPTTPSTKTENTHSDAFAIPIELPQTRYRKLQALMYRILLHPEHDSAAPDRAWIKRIRILLESIIVLNVIVVVLETVHSIEVEVGHAFLIVDLISVIIFTAEYILRIWAAPVGDRIRSPSENRSPLRSRLAYIFSFWGAIDLIAILPFLAHLVAFGDLRIVRALRLLRIERVLEMGKYSRGLRLIREAVRSRRQELVAAFGVIFLIMLIASSLMYVIEHDAQPDKFASIPEAIWWSIATLTTVGYGDIFPITPLGKVFAAIIALLGIGLVAIPSGIILTGFQEQMNKKDSLPGRFCPHCGHELAKVD